MDVSHSQWDILKELNTLDTIGFINPIYRGGSLQSDAAI